MSTFDVVFALKGVEDVLRGTATATVPVSAGGTRTINPLSGTFLDKDYDFEGDGDYIFNGEFQATGDVYLGGGGSKVVRIGDTLDVISDPVLEAYGKSVFYGQVGFEENVTVASGKVLDADEATFNDVAIAGSLDLNNATVDGTVEATGAWLFDSEVQTVSNVILANAADKTLQVGPSGAADTTPVGTYYGLHTFEGNVSLKGDTTIEDGTATDFAVTTLVVGTPVGGGTESLKTDTFYASGDATIGGDLDVTGTVTAAGFEISGESVIYSGGAFGFSAPVSITGDLTVDGDISYTGALTAAFDTITFNGGVSNAAASYEQYTISALTTGTTLSIVDKNFIGFDNTAADVTISTLTGDKSKIVLLTNYGTKIITLAAGIMKGGVAVALAAGEGGHFYYDSGSGKFYSLTSL